MTVPDERLRCHSSHDGRLTVAGGSDVARRPGIERIEASASVDDLSGLLADGLTSGDLTTLLLEVAARRASSRRPADLVAQHGTDRLVAPVLGDGRARARAALTMLLALPDDIEVVELAPVLPLGSHSAVATVHQDKVVATTRSSEVAADPTNGLTLEAAARRTQLRHDPEARRTPVRLAGLQRVLRAQPFDDPRFHQHFWLLGLVTAGRVTGGDDFEVSTATGDLAALVTAAGAAGATRVQVRVTDLTGGRAPLLDPLRAALHDPDGHDHGDGHRCAVEVVDAPERDAGRGYYDHSCWKLMVAGPGGDLAEVGDGGFTDWTRTLCSDAKERLHIGGVAPGTLQRALAGA